MTLKVLRRWRHQLRGRVRITIVPTAPVLLTLIRVPHATSAATSSSSAEASAETTTGLAIALTSWLGTWIRTVLVHRLHLLMEPVLQHRVVLDLLQIVLVREEHPLVRV